MRSIRAVLLVLAVAALAAAPVLGLSVARPHTLAMSAPAGPVAPSSDAPSSLLWLLPAMGTIKVRNTADIAKKFVRNASAASGDYATAAAASGGDWEAGARAGEENYKLAVTQAAQEGRFGKGVAAAGAARYTAKVQAVGAQRFQTGVQAAEADFARGAGPVLDVIRNLSLPPRRPKGDPSNQQRAQVVATALRAFKLGRS
jgi:hypothetical protein